MSAWSTDWLFYKLCLSCTNPCTWVCSSIYLISSMKATTQPLNASQSFHTTNMSLPDTLTKYTVGGVLFFSRCLLWVYTTFFIIHQWYSHLTLAPIMPSLSLILSAGPTYSTQAWFLSDHWGWSSIWVQGSIWVVWFWKNWLHHKGEPSNCLEAIWYVNII